MSGVQERLILVEFIHGDRAARFMCSGFKENYRRDVAFARDRGNLARISLLGTFEFEMQPVYYSGTTIQEVTRDNAIGPLSPDVKLEVRLNGQTITREFAGEYLINMPDGTIIVKVHGRI